MLWVQRVFSELTLLVILFIGFCLAFWWLDWDGEMELSDVGVGGASQIRQMMGS